MSVLTIVQKDGVVAIAADLLSTQGSCKVPASHKAHPGKIVQINDSFIGVTGSTAHIRVLESLASNHASEFDLSSQSAVFETLRKLHSRLVENYFLRTDEDDDDQPYDSSQLNLLIANRTGIYEVQGYREVMQYQKFWATGSGYRFSLGAMEALYEDERWSAKELAERGVEVGCLFDDSSGLPLESYTVKLGD